VLRSCRFNASQQSKLAVFSQRGIRVTQRTGQGVQLIPFWRPLSLGDLPEVNRIADAVHLDLPERPEVFDEKFRLYPQGCFALVQDAKLVGYGLSHPWTLNEIPPLDEFLVSLPNPAACLYVHDVVILPCARGHSMAEVLIGQLTDVVMRDGIGAMALVSVYGTHSLWGTMGFRGTSNPSLSQKLKTYGPTARYMVKQLSG
jgi:hypothetical protein